MFYYPDDKELLEAYAGFCERNNYDKKATELYQKLYDLTKDEFYLSKKYELSIKSSELSSKDFDEIIQDKRIQAFKKSDLNNGLILKYFYKKDWKNTKLYCDKIAKKDLNGKTVRACALACEHLSDKKAAYQYYLRYAEIEPKNTDVIKKILAFAQEYNDLANQEKFLKKFSALNPKDKGLQYRLAGFYEKQKNYAKAVKIYENLMAQGDTSQHVKDSYAFLTKKPPSPEVYKAGAAPKSKPYKPKPLTAQQIKEQALYKALDNKDFEKAQVLIEELLRKNPKSEPFLKLRFDIAMAQDNYNDALSYFPKATKQNPYSLEQEKLRAFLYSKTDDFPKALEIIDGLLAKNQGNKDLLTLALEYSMASKNYDKALTYTNELLPQDPDSEKLLKTLSDIYSIQKDFAKAIKAYENLIAKYPKDEYKTTLLGLYMANQNFAEAQKLIEPMYAQKPHDKKLVVDYLNILMAQNKLDDAYLIVKTHNLGNSKEGSNVLGDLAMRDKNFAYARNYYRNALRFAPDDNSLKNNLAQSYRMLKEIDYATAIYKDVLYRNPNNLNALLGLGYLEIDKEEYGNARHIFERILTKKPEYTPAKIGIANSYIGYGDHFQTLDTLEPLFNNNNQARLMAAQTYFDMMMPAQSKYLLSGLAGEDADDLRYKIRRENAITITPTYSRLTQNLGQQFNLDYNQVGTIVSQRTKHNLDLFAEYNMFVYGSSPIQPSLPKQSGVLHNLTNEIRFGTQGRPTEKYAFRADMGAKFYQFNDNYLLLTDSWIKKYFSDDFNLKLGVSRNNLVQSYLSAVGLYVGDNFTGPVADNRLYLEYEKKLPNRYYSFGRYCMGLMSATNLTNNPYMEGMIGVGRVAYNNPDNKFINKINVDLVSYNSGYRYNLLKIYDSMGNLYGGYFSPQYFTANTLGLKFEGDIKKWHLKYGLKGFGGSQFAARPHLNTITWGIGPYLKYDLNDNVTFNASVNHYSYGDIQRDIFIFNVVIRGFKRRAKSK